MTWPTSPTWAKVLTARMIVLTGTRAISSSPLEVSGGAPVGRRIRSSQPGVRSGNQDRGCSQLPHLTPQ